MVAFELKIFFTLLTHVQKNKHRNHSEQEEVSIFVKCQDYLHFCLIYQMFQTFIFWLYVSMY